MNNVMIDIETLDTAPTSIILSIGAVYFDSIGLGKEFYQPVTLASQENRTWSASTLLWWMTQNEEARKAAYLNESAISLYNALQELGSFIESSDNLIWTNGPDFDATILQDAYRQLGLVVPWKYSNNRCYRTFRSFHKEILITRLDAHNALADAKYQALHMIEWFKGEKG
jgi:hypothetical protein